MGPETKEDWFIDDYLKTWALAFMSGFLAANGLDDAGPNTPDLRAAEKEGLVAMGAKPFWGRDNVKAYHKVKKEIRALPRQMREETGHRNA